METSDFRFFLRNIKSSQFKSKSKENPEIDKCQANTKGNSLNKGMKKLIFAQRNFQAKQ